MYTNQHFVQKSRLVVIILLLLLGFWPGSKVVQGAEWPSSSEATLEGDNEYDLYLPIILNGNEQASDATVPGLIVDIPIGWQAPEPPIAPELINDLADMQLARFYAPDQTIYLDVVVNWYLPPGIERPFGDFSVNPDPRYEETTQQLATGEVVQVIHAVQEMDGSVFLLAQAAFQTEQASYAIQLFGTRLDAETTTIFDAIWQHARTEAFLDGYMRDEPEHSTALNTGQALVGNTSEMQVAYDPTSAVLYANTYVNVFDNSDDCYLWYNGVILLCYYQEGHWGVDGAHFVNRALKAGGLPAPEIPQPAAKNSGALRSWLLENGGQEVGDPNSLVPGDVIFFGRNGCWGWEGLVVDVDINGPKLHLHSLVKDMITSNWPNARYTQVTYNACGQTNQYSFVHIASAQEQPGPLLNQSLVRVPATPFAAGEVQVSFQVCNFGGVAFDTDSLYIETTAPGQNFPTVNPPALAPGACYDYSQSLAAFPEAGWYTIRAGYVDGGSFRVLDTVAGVVNEQAVYVVSPDAIQIEGDLIVSPDVVWQADTATVTFSARNTSSATLTDAFIVRVYDENYPVPGSLVAEFPMSGDVVLSPGEFYTYEDSLTLNNPGVYWIVGEHSAGGNWVPVYGDSTKGFRVRYPMPEVPELAKGMPPYIALAGEPVNVCTGNFVHQHLDFSIPLDGVPFAVMRYYNHWDAHEVAGDFGPGWTWSFDRHITWRSDKTAVMTYPDGREVYLVAELDENDPFNVESSYAGQLAEMQTIERFEDGTAQLVGTDQWIYDFDVAGLLVGIHNGNHIGFEIVRNADGQIQQVVHTNGMVFNFAYSGGQLTSIQTGDGYGVIYTYNSEGDLVQVQKPDETLIRYGYDLQHRILTVDDALSQTFLTNTYDGENRIATQVDASGLESSFEYSGNETTSFVNEAGETVQYTFDEYCRALSETDARGAVTTHEYDEHFNRTKTIDPEGGVWLWEYDAFGRVTAAVNPLGARWEYEYDEAGNLVLERDPLGAETKHEYDAFNNRSTTIDAAGNVFRWEYDEYGFVIKYIDPLSAEVVYENNSFGQPVKITDPLGNITIIERDERGNKTKIIDAEGRTTTFVYDEGNRIIAMTNPLGRITTFTYDENGNLISESDGMGHTRTYVFDEQDHLLAFSDFAGSIWHQEYDVSGWVVYEENPLGGTIRYTRDVMGNILTRKDERGGIWTYGYDLNNNEIILIDPLGNTIYKTYDAANQLINLDRPCETCPGGRTIERFTYDLAGRLVTQTDGRGFTTSFVYDEVGHLVATIDPLGYITRYVYNARGDKIEEIDALGHSTVYAYNMAGWLISKTDRLGYLTQYSYDRVGNLKTITNPRGFVTTYVYDAADQLIEIIDPLGNTIHNEYDLRGNLLRSIDAAGRETTFEYDANGNILQEINPRGFTTTYRYDLLNRMLEKIDALGGVTTFTYDPLGAVLTQTDAAGYTTTFTYNLVGWMLTRTDSNGYVTRFEHDAYGRITRMVDPLGGETRSTYDANGNLLTLTNALGYTTTFEYDARNQQVKVIDALGGFTTMVYDALGHVTTEIDANGHETVHTYDAEGRRTSTTDALGHVATFAYDPNGNLTRYTDRNGHAMTSVYDGLDRVVELSNRLGFISTVRYDAVGNPLEETNFRGFTTTRVFDENNNLAQVTDALGGVTTTVYDALDRPTHATDANGHTTITTYDAVGNLVAVTLPEGQTTTVTYDGEHNRVSLTNAKDTSTLFVYDALNRPIQEIDPLGNVIQTEYDAVGQVIREVDAEGHAQSFTYDRLGRLVTVTDALGYATTYTYDAVGNLLTETDANGHTTTYMYDALRLIQETNPIGAVWTYAYDPEGNLIYERDANGQEIHYTFDAEGQLVAIDYPLGTPDVTYQFDPNGNLVRMVDGEGESTFLYDALDRLVQQVDTFGRVTSYLYDAVGNRLSIHYPSGNVVSYTYNANDWMSSMTDPSLGMTTYSYDPDGLPLMAHFPNNTWLKQEYDVAGRLISLLNGTSYFPHGIVMAYTYTLDKVGNRLQVVEQYTQGQVRTNVKTYLYNARNELLSAVEQYEGPPTNMVTTTYVYDPVGNRVKMTTDRDDEDDKLEETIYSYDAANHLLQAGEVVYTYDANGNRLSKLTSDHSDTKAQLETYTYDAENRLVLYEQVHTQDSQAEQRVYNRYDGLGRRVLKGTQNGEGTVKWVEYTLDRLSFDQLVEYPQTGDPTIAELYRGQNNVLVSMGETEDEDKGGGNQYWFAADGLQSVVATTKHNGQSSQEVFYDAYGQLLDDKGEWEDSFSNDPHLHYLLNGKEWDEESRLYYMGARYYDAETGLWLTQDPYRGMLTSPMTRHRTLYVRNNPVNRVDPLGYFDFQTGAVEWGDTWESVAAQWGTNVAELKRLNSYINTPKVGDYLRLPECRSAECQLQLGLTQVRIGGLSGTECGQRLTQRQQAYKAWLAEQQRLAELRRLIDEKIRQIQEKLEQRMEKLEAVKQADKLREQMYTISPWVFDVILEAEENWQNDLGYFRNRQEDKQDEVAENDPLKAYSDDHSIGRYNIKPSTASSYLQWALSSDVDIAKYYGFTEMPENETLVRLIMNENRDSNLVALHLNQLKQDHPILKDKSWEDVESSDEYLAKIYSGYMGAGGTWDTWRSNTMPGGIAMERLGCTQTSEGISCSVIQNLRPN